VNDRVREAYDRIAEAYASQRDLFKNQVYLEQFVGMLVPRARVLDLGCGGGIPAARFLVDRGFDVIGLDISPAQIELARRNVPQARFEVADMQQLARGRFAVDGVIALYSIFHIDRREHFRLLETLRSYLPIGGVLLITMGASEWEGSEVFHGAEMFWSHYGPKRNRELLEAAGLTVLVDELDTSGGEEHQVLLAHA
jgi:cyclopropane fatty-acyl-phospholipid synthase-like methyltransferase